MVQGQALLDLETDSEDEEEHVSGSQVAKKRKTRGRSRAARKLAKTKKWAEAMEGVTLQSEPSAGIVESADTAT